MSKRLSEDQIDEIVRSLEVKVGMGDPTSPYFGQLLSEEEEKILDAKGERVVSGLPWSEARTGLWLTVAVCPERFAVDASSLLGGEPIPVVSHLTGKPFYLYVTSSEGKPVFTKPVAGASLELPVDLGRDELKRKYVVEWLRDTSAESLALMGISYDGKPKEYAALGLWVASAAEAAIVRTGL